MVDEWLEPPAYENPICPECGEECEKLFKRGNEIIGCEHCVDEIDAYEWKEEQKYEEKEW